MRKLLVLTLCAQLIVLATVAIWRHDDAARAAPAPPRVASGDTNGDGAIDIGDAIYLVNWLFLGGEEPAACAQEVDCPACALSDAEIAQLRAVLTHISVDRSGVLVIQNDQGVRIASDGAVTINGGSVRVQSETSTQIIAGGTLTARSSADVVVRGGTISLN